MASRKRRRTRRTSYAHCCPKIRVRCTKLNKIGMMSCTVRAGKHSKKFSACTTAMDKATAYGNKLLARQAKRRCRKSKLFIDVAKKK